MGGEGFNKLSAIANHSSVAKMTLAPRSEDVSSTEVLFQSMSCLLFQTVFQEGNPKNNKNTAKEKVAQLAVAEVDMYQLEIYRVEI